MCKKLELLSCLQELKQDKNQYVARLNIGRVPLDG